MKQTDNKYLKLLKTWADNLIDLQVTDNKRNEFHGGIMCPACKVMHGRIGDTMYPLMYLYSKTGDRKYYDSAKLCYKWVMHNMLRNKGQFINDACSTWVGITIFFNIQLGELLYELEEYINPGDYKEWMNTYIDTCNYICDTLDVNKKAVINYIVGTATAMAIARKLLNEEKYYKKAKLYEKYILEHFTEEGFLFGEGKIPSRATTPGGYHTVDLGYNVEESLPNLCLYIKFMDNVEEIKNILLKSMKVHLEFMLPDGGWDNSWGARTAKWTYWGSRTSDGCQIAYEYFADYDDTFFEAAYRNFEMYKKCTSDGLLAGGIHYKKMNEPVCIHHSFCHLKSLVCMSNTKHKPQKGIKLPREIFDGIKTYDSMNVSVAKKGDWTATYSCDDYAIKVPEDTPSGGAVTLLYHNRAGVILTGGQNEYVLVEPLNMQIPRHFNDVCQLPRIELKFEEYCFRNTYDTSATILTKDNKSSVVYRAEGILRDYTLKGSEEYKTEYILNENKFVIKATTCADGAKYILPIVTIPEEKIELNKNTVTIEKEKATVIIESSHKIEWDLSKDERIFNCNGGFATAHFTVDMPKNKTVIFEFTVK